MARQSKPTRLCPTFPPSWRSLFPTYTISVFQKLNCLGDYFTDKTLISSLQILSRITFSVGCSSIRNAFLSHLLITCSFSRQDYNSRIVGGSATPTVWNILPQFPRLAVRTVSFDYFFDGKFLEGLRSCLISAHSNRCSVFFQAAFQLFTRDEGEKTAEGMTEDRLIKQMKDRTGVEHEQLTIGVEHHRG